MTDFEWPDDQAFRKFAAKIADAVTVAINNGVSIGTKRGCRCPLGCITRVTQPNQCEFSHDRRGSRLGWRNNHVSAFYVGFEGWKPTAVGRHDRAYYQLGLAYRARFVEGVK